MFEKQKESYTKFKNVVLFENYTLDIPEDWDIHRLRHIFSFRKGLTITKENLQEEGVPCLNYGEIHSKFGFSVTPEKDTLPCVDEKYLESNNSSLIKHGDFIFADTSEDIAGSGNFSYLNSKQKIFAGYHTVIASLKSEQNERFLAYLFDSQSFREQIQRRTKGVKVYSITQAILKPTYIWLPSPQEQKEIVYYLDSKISKVDELIIRKEKQIELLSERKRIIIQNAVLSGIDSHVSMKDSGISWIGDIPSHWTLKRLKYILSERNDRSSKGEEPLLMMSQVHGLVVRSEFHSKAEVAATNKGNKIVYKNDLVFNKLKSHLGVFFKSNIDFEGLVSPDYAVYKPKAYIKDMKILEVLFRHPKYIEQFIIRATGIVEGLIRLYTDDLFDITIPIAPEDEQQEILDFIECESKKFDDSIKVFQKQIEKLKEYKVTLINSAVTGKIKVPETT